MSLLREDANKLLDHGPSRYLFRERHRVWARAGQPEADAGV